MAKQRRRYAVDDSRRFTRLDYAFHVIYSNKRKDISLGNVYIYILIRILLCVYGFREVSTRPMYERLFFHVREPICFPYALFDDNSCRILDGKERVCVGNAKRFR